MATSWDGRDVGDPISTRNHGGVTLNSRSPALGVTRITEPTLAALYTDPMREDGARRGERHA
jgi:hypothetical protein